MKQNNVPRLTIGIEEEFQIVDGQGQLKSHIETLLAAAGGRFGDQLKREMMQSVVEAGTKICADVSEARDEIATLRGSIAALLKPAGLRIASAGTHPFSHWQDQDVTEAERYKILEEELQDVIRELLIFGLHVHVGIPDPELRIEVMNEARYFLPHLLAISTSSPFWLTRITGLKSYRQIIWQRFPRTGVPPEFTSWDDYENFVELLVKTASIDIKAPSDQRFPDILTPDALTFLSRLHNEAEPERDGLLERGSHSSRALRLTARAEGKRTSRLPSRVTPFRMPVERDVVSLPVLGEIAAGQPIEAYADAAESLDVPRSIEARDGSYVLRVRGKSMIDALIDDGDYVIVQPQATARDGDIVVALLEDNGVTLKRFFREQERIRLQPANSEMEPIFASEVQIQGKVVGVIRKLA